jgi:hypothetical protein
MRGIGREICRNVLMRLSAFSPRSGENAHLSFRSLALWTLGYPESALASGDRALQAAREIGDADVNVCAVQSKFHPYPLRSIRDSKRAARRTSCFGGRQRSLVSEGHRNVRARMAFSLGRESIRGKANNHLRSHRISLNGSNTMDAIFLIRFSASVGRAWSIRRCPALRAAAGFCSNISSQIRS